MFAMNGLLQIPGEYDDEAIAKLSYSLADKMIEARKPKEEVGITAVKRRKKND
jgi:hypothetical protein